MSDKKTIGITDANGTRLKQLVDAGGFASELDAAKFAMAYAIRNGLPAGTTDGAETKWNVGSLDADGSLRSVIEALIPGTTEPYRIVEHLMNAGISALTAVIAERGDIYSVIFEVQPFESRRLLDARGFGG